LRRFLANALQRPWLSIQTRRAAILYRWLVSFVVHAVSIEQLVAGFRRTVFVKIRISYQGEDLATQCD
jgi:hypothetical protein